MGRPVSAAPTKRARLRANAPCFMDPELTRPGQTHAPSCPIAKDAANGRCNCGGGRSILTRNTRGDLLDERERAVLFQVHGRSSVWIERALIYAEGPSVPRAIRAHSAPPDLIIARAWWAARPKLGRCRRIPKTGELALIRAGARAGEGDLWRLLTITGQGESTTCVLIDPMLSPGDASMPDWASTRFLDAPGGAGRALIGVFPLPDGTRSPGWAPELAQRETSKEGDPRQPPRRRRRRRGRR